MCHLSMKLSGKFDSNQMYTSDKIVVKYISMKEALLKLDNEPKGQGHSKQQNNKLGNKNILPLNKQSKALLGNCSATKVKNYQINCHHYWKVSGKYDQIKLLRH